MPISSPTRSPPSSPPPPTTPMDTTSGKTEQTSSASPPNNVGDPTGGQGGGNNPSSTSPSPTPTAGGGSKPTSSSTVNAHSATDPNSPPNTGTSTSAQSTHSSSSSGLSDPQKPPAPSTSPFSTPTTHGNEPSSPSSSSPISSTTSSSQSSDIPGSLPTSPPTLSLPSISLNPPTISPSLPSISFSLPSISFSLPSISFSLSSIPSSHPSIPSPTTGYPSSATATETTPRGDSTSPPPSTPSPSAPMNSNPPGESPGGPSSQPTKPTGSSAPANPGTPVPATILSSTGPISPPSRSPTGYPPTGPNPSGPPASPSIGSASGLPSPSSGQTAGSAQYSNPGSTPTSGPTAPQNPSQIPSGAVSLPPVRGAVGSSTATGSSSDYIRSSPPSAPFNVAVPSTTITSGESITVGMTTTQSAILISSKYPGTTFISTSTAFISVPVISVYTPISSNTSNPSNKHNDGALIGGVVGGIVALIMLLTGLCFFLRARRRASQHQQLHDADLATPLSPGTVEAMQESHPFHPAYNPVSAGQTSRATHELSPSFGSSAELQYPVTLIPGPTSPYAHVHSASGSAFIEHDLDSNDGYTSNEDGADTEYSTDTEPEAPFASAKESMTGSMYTARNATRSQTPSRLNVGTQIGLAIGSQSSLPNSFYTAQTGHDLLTPTTQGDDDDDYIADTPSPSAFPIPPWNPFVDASRVLGSTAMNSSSQTFGPAAGTDRTPRRLRTLSAQEASWAAAVTAASPMDTDTPTAYSLSFAFSPHATKEISAQEAASAIDVKTPTQANPLHEGDGSGYDGGSGSGSSADSHDTYTPKYTDPFADPGNADLLGPTSQSQPTAKNRLSNASSVVEVPDNLSQCGIAL